MDNKDYFRSCILVTVVPCALVRADWNSGNMRQIVEEFCLIMIVRSSQKKLLEFSYRSCFNIIFFYTSKAWRTLYIDFSILICDCLASKRQACSNVAQIEKLKLAKSKDLTQSRGKRRCHSKAQVYINCGIKELLFQVVRNIKWEVTI